MANPLESAGRPPDADAYRLRMQRRQQVQAERLAARQQEKGLVIVHTGNGKGKTTAALGMVVRALGHGYRVGIVQFIKGAWDPGEARLFQAFPDQVSFEALGEGFTWETQDWHRDQARAEAAWTRALTFLQDATIHLTVLDEINIALKQGYLSLDTVLAGLSTRPPHCHVVLTGRGAPDGLIERADLVTEMTLVKHPFRDQGVKAQAGIEY